MTPFDWAIIVLALLAVAMLFGALLGIEMTQPNQPRPSSPGGRGQTVRRETQRPEVPALPYRSKTA